MYLRIDFNKKTYVRQPNFIRSRLTLRAPIRSQNVNLEDQQLSYDIYNLNAKMDATQSTINSDFSVLEDLIADIAESLQSMRRRLTTIEEN